MRRLAIIAALLLVLSACQADITEPTGTDSPSTIAATETTGPAPTTTASPTTTVPAVESPPLLLAAADGIRLLGAEPVVFLEGTPATIAVPDLLGGVVYQGVVPQVTGLHHDEALGRNVFEWAQGGPEPIWHLASPGAEPVPIVTHPDARLSLVDVVESGGHAAVLYRMLIGGAGGDEAWQQVLEWLCLYDLATGRTQMLGLVGSYESSYTQMRIGGDLVAVGFDPYGEAFGTQIGFLPVATLAEPVEYAWLPRLVTDHLMYGPAEACEQTPGCQSWATVTAASNGARVTWVQGGYVTRVAGSTEPLPTEIVVLDRASGEETLRIELSSVMELDQRPRFVDDDGSTIVVSGVGGDDDVAVVAADGTVRWLDFPGATVSIWQADLSTSTDPLTLRSTLPMRGDGIGELMFGTVVDEAMAYLEVEAGPPSSEQRDMYHAFDCDHLGLTLLFAPADDGVERFVGWAHWPGSVVTPMQTSQGIAVGDTLGELLAAHGASATVVIGDDECMPAWYVELADPSTEWHVVVELDGQPDDPSSVISGMWAGAGYGC